MNLILKCKACSATFLLAKGFEFSFFAPSSITLQSASDVPIAPGLFSAAEDEAVVDRIRELDRFFDDHIACRLQYGNDKVFELAYEED